MAYDATEEVIFTDHCVISLCSIIQNRVLMFAVGFLMIVVIAVAIYFITKRS